MRMIKLIGKKNQKNKQTNRQPNKQPSKQVAKKQSFDYIPVEYDEDDYSALLKQSLEEEGLIGNKN